MKKIRRKKDLKSFFRPWAGYIFKVMSDKTGGTESEELFSSRTRLADSSDFDHTKPLYTLGT